MDIKPDVLSAIGNTPLIKLRRASEETGCTILGKAEFMNPGQSVKDRAALFIVEDAVRRGLLRPGGVIVEGTAGNTGIGLALVASVLGFRTLIVIPETQSQEKKDMLRLAGAELLEVPAVPYANPEQLRENFRAVSRSASPNPNPMGRSGRTSSTTWPIARAMWRRPGREIWEQTDGTVDGFVCAVGTGGTLAGVGMALKERNPKVQIALADPMGAALYSYYTTGKLAVDPARRSPKASGRAGSQRISRGRRSTWRSRSPTKRRCRSSSTLLEHEGLCLGGSSGINVAGAIRLARHLGPGHTIVTDPVRFGIALPVQALQSGFPAGARDCRCPNGWRGHRPSIPGLWDLNQSAGKRLCREGRVETRASCEATARVGRNLDLHHLAGGQQA